LIEKINRKIEAFKMRTEPQLRKQQVKALKQYYKQSRQRFEKWAAVGYKKPPPAPIPFPEICEGMKCEAKTRSGHPCRNDGTKYGSGRCKFHGGTSTGPKTKQGKKRASMNSLKNEAHELFTNVNL
jgi:hypothetical protein